MALWAKIIDIVFVSSLLLFPSVFGWTCFFPDGNIASNYISCSSNNDGNCCVEGDLCTSIGYCLSNTHAFYYRGACTDQAWGNPSCPDYCLANQNSGNSSSISVIPCDAAANGGTWCCAYNGNCCSGPTYTPYFGSIINEEGTPQTTLTSAVSTIPVIQQSTTPPSVVYIPTAVAPLQQQTSQISESAETSQVLQASHSSQTSKTSLITSQTSQSSQQSQTSQTTQPSQASQVLQTSVTSTLPGAITTPTQQSQISPTSTSTPQKTEHIGMIVGAAVGIPLGLAALAGLLLFLRERRKRQREAIAANPDPPPVQEMSTYVYFGSEGPISKDIIMAQEQALKKYAEAAKVPVQEIDTPPRFELSSHGTPELDGAGWRRNHF